MALPFFHSTTNIGSVFGAAYTRMKGLILSGTLGTTEAGPIEGPAGIAVIQPALVCSTLGPKAQVLSTAAAAINAANFIYIPQTTGTIFVSATTAGTIQPPQSGMGAALLWDAANKRLNVYSTVHEWVSQLSSVGGGYFSSS